MRTVIVLNMNGALLKEWMTANDIKPEQLAVKIGVSYGTIRNLLAGKKPFRPTITVLANLMGVSEETLMGQQKKPRGK
jgi:transcriptional regulator with XRE-family HTH domain